MCLNLSRRRFIFLSLIVLCLGIVIALFFYRNTAVRSVQRVTLNTLTLAKLPNLPLLQVGDVVLRRGVGADSLVISTVSQSRFSHCGIVVAIEPVVLVTHATTADDQGIADYLAYLKSMQHQAAHALIHQESTQYQNTNTKASANTKAHTRVNSRADMDHRLDPNWERVYNIQSQLAGDRVITMPLKFYIEQATDLAVVRYTSITPDMYHKMQTFLSELEGYPFSLDTNNPDSIYCTTLIEKALNQIITTSLSRHTVEMPMASGVYLFPEAFLHDQQAQVIFQYENATSSTNQQFNQSIERE